MKYGNRVGKWRRFQGPILALAMLSMHFRVIQQRRRRLLPRQDLAQDLGIAFEQGIDSLGHLAGHATDHARLTDVGLGALVIRALGLDQALIELGPFVVLQADRLQDGQEQHLLHRSGSSPCQPGMIQGAARLDDDGSPAEVRFERGRRGEIVDRADRRDHGGGHHRPDPWKRPEDLPLACLFDDAHDFGLQLLDVLAQEAKLFDQLCLFQHETPLPSQVFGADTLRRQALQFQEFGVGERTGTAPYLLQGREAGGGQGLWRGKLLAQGKRDQRIGIFHDARQFWKDLVADGSELVLALGTLADQFIAVTDQSFELSGGLRRGNDPSDELQFVGDLHPQFELAVELVGQRQRVAFVRFEHACRSTLHMHDVDRDVQVLQVLLKGAVMVARALHQDEHVLMRTVAADPLDEQAEALAGILENERWAGLEAVMPRKQGLREEASHVFSLANVNADIQGLIQQHRNRFEVWMCMCSFGHGAVLLPSTQLNRRWVERSEPVEVSLPSTAEGFLAVPTDISGVLSTSPTEGQGVCPHYVKRGLRAHALEERLPGDLSISQSTQKEARKQEATWQQVSGCLPTLRRAISTWTSCGGRLAPRRATEGYTAEPAALARLVCRAYHRCPGRMARRPRCLDSLAPDARRAGPPLCKPERFRQSMSRVTNAERRRKSEDG